MRKKAHRFTFLLFALVMVMVVWGVAAAETLRVQMILFWDAYQYMINEVVPAFEAQYGVDVEFERVTWANREEKLILATVSGAPPDVFMNGAEHVVDLVAAGLVAPLDDYLRNWDDLEDFVPVTFENSAWNGHQYGIPLYTDPRVFWYRTDFFEEVGLDPDDPPSNWDELLQAARRLTVTDGNVVTRMGYDLTRWTGNASSAIQDFIVFLWQNGGDLVDPATSAPLFHSPQGVETMEFLKDLQDAVKAPGNVVDAGQGQGSPIVRGTAAMNLNISGVSSEAERYGGDYVVQHLRAIVPPPGQVENVSVVFSNWLAIHADSRNKDLAWEFIKFVMEPERLFRLNRLLGFISPRRSTVADFVREQPLVVYPYETLNYTKPFPVFPNAGVVGSALRPQYFRILSGEISAEVGLAEAARLWEAHLP